MTNCENHFVDTENASMRHGVFLGLVLCTGKERRRMSSYVIDKYYRAKRDPIIGTCLTFLNNSFYFHPQNGRIYGQYNEYKYVDSLYHMVLL